MHMLILGHGYTAKTLTPLLVNAGWTVSGTTRMHPRHVIDAGAAPILWPGEEARVCDEIARADAILIATAPERQVEGVTSETSPVSPDPVIARFRKELLAAKPLWIGYLSSTNVYGDHNGAWVDETTPPMPGTMRAVIRLDAENAWRKLAQQTGWPLKIFRLAGIYGPGRGPFEKLRAGKARRIIKSGQVFSRIHVEDIAGVLLASLEKHTPPIPGTEIYNVCDDQPASPERVIEIAAGMLGVPAPPIENFATAKMTPMARSFYADSKRVRNNRIKQVLGYRLRYPDYQSGLTAILAADQVD